ncbi:Retrovirus-related Pol polyprotein from transposon 17.6,Retrovirus-related Pol polyprotein from transposon 297 [Mytilus edulis]|uniref:Retrovirus-related Pol polyprotein from transposon 17.6,Retrovirus-related Pol polyprotein from transposon 297 n=1 Tax=Mytilus edulis TaxID=6550 RepID=A0A8S3VD93_MYTED|nr:Retrovirus-related Pol polyprotein from transposon 17.6,Retrovirus-related Pol polyprotein from transposon 297 [Mytilus edulis]
MNVENEAKTIFPGTTIAQMCEISHVAKSLPSQNDGQNKKGLRSDLHDLLNRTSDKLSRSEKQKVKSLVQEYESLFAETDSDLGKTSLVKHEIETGNARPFKEPPRRTPFHLSKVVNDNIDKMLENKVIEPSHSPWAAGIVLVKKKDDTYRFCVDYRKLNSVTINKDAYPLPRIDESLDHLAGNSWFSTLDCCSGYWQVELAEKDKHKTAFATRKGLFQFKVMPFGLCCAAQTFERLMETVLAGLQWEVCLVYLDDIIVFGKTLDDMLVNLRTVFDRLKSAGLKLKAKKCNLCVTMVRYLGHIISEDGIATDPEKIKVVQNWPVPTNPTEVRSFLGLCSYYRKFIKNFASIAKCLHVLTEKGKRFEWISDCQHAFDLLKIKLTNAPILTHPDFNKEFILDTDASNVALGGVLSQRHEDGTQHRNADALSRIPCKQCGYTLDWQSKTSSDCHKTEESQVKIVTSQMPDHDTDWTLTDKQSNDPDLKLVKQWLTDGQRPLYNEVSGKGFFIRSLWSQFNSLELQDDLVFRHFYDNERKVVKLQAVIPLSERKQVLHFCHDAKYAGHLGMRKTLEKIRQSYYWPGLQADVRAYVAGCDKCAMRKTPTKKKRAPMAIVETSSPMERLATDILGELPETENGNRYILVVSDYYTKWTESFPMPNMEASTVVKIIVEEVIARFGVPSWIHSDQGRQYESRLFQEVCKVLDIKKTRTTPYHPQSDGMVERFNKTLATMLSAYVQEHQRDWDKYIPFVMMAYRASEHDTTGQTPNRLMFGRESTTPLDILYEMPPSIKGIPQHKWAWELKERLEDAHSFVRQRMPGEMRRQKRYHDLKLSYESFRSGDQVYVYFPKSGDLTYKVDCGIRGTPQIIHVDRIKLKHKQVLRGEMSEDIDNPQVTEPREADIFDDVIDQDDRIGIEEESGRRERKRPVWMADYILD